MIIELSSVNCSNIEHLVVFKSGTSYGRMSKVEEVHRAGRDGRDGGGAGGAETGPRVEGRACRQTTRADGRPPAAAVDGAVDDRHDGRAAGELNDNAAPGCV